MTEGAEGSRAYASQLFWYFAHSSNGGAPRLLRHQNTSLQEKCEELFSTNREPARLTTMSATRTKAVATEELPRPSKSHSAPRMDQQTTKFQSLLTQYEHERRWLEAAISSADPLVALQDPDIRNARIAFALLTRKVIRKDPKLVKTKYDDVFWRSVMYPLIRGVYDMNEIRTSPVLQTTFQDLATAGCAVFRCFIDTFLVRFGLKVNGVEDLPELCEICETQSGDGGTFKPEHVAWIRSFISRCLCSIGDLYRYSEYFDQKSFAMASFYYELAALSRPLDGRAVSCLGIVQKELGEPFAATFYCLLSACKKNRYPYFLKNLEVLTGPINELCNLYQLETEKPHLDDDPREIIKVFSVHILKIVHGMLLEDDFNLGEMRARFSTALDYLSATLERPPQDGGSWKSSHYTVTTYLHPNLLWKVCVMAIAVYHLKNNEVDVKRGGQLGILCAFIVAMMSKITNSVIDNLRHWISYTGFNLVAEPDPEISLRELDRLRQAVESKFVKKLEEGSKSKGIAIHAATYNPDCPEEYGNGDGPLVLGPASARFEDDLDLQSMEEYWVDASLDDSSSSFDFSDPEYGQNGDVGSSYLQAFLGFMDTQMHLPLITLLFGWMRYDREMWSFCVVNSPDIICNIVDIINLLCIPRFVDLYITRNQMGAFPLEIELFLRKTLPIQDWVDDLDWSGWHMRKVGLTETEKVVLVSHRFNSIVKILQKMGLTSFDAKSKKWICSLQRRQLNLVPESCTTTNRKLDMAMKLGKAWQAEENKEKERSYMARRADLPKYLIVDTSCLLRRLEFVQRLYDCKKFKLVIPSYVLEELDRGKKNRTVRDAIRWMDMTTETKDLGRLEIQRWKDMHQHDSELENDWNSLTNTERSVRVMVDCTKFFSQDVKRLSDNDPEYGLNILVLTDLDLQSVYCARVIEQMERLDIPHEIKLMRIHDFMGWLDEGPSYFRRLQEQEERDRLD